MRAWREGTMLMQQGAQCSRGRFFASRTLATACIWVSEGGKGSSGRETNYIYIFCARRPLRLPPPPSSAFRSHFRCIFFPQVARVVDLLASTKCFLLPLAFTSHRQF